MSDGELAAEGRLGFKWRAGLEGEVLRRVRAALPGFECTRHAEGPAGTVGRVCWRNGSDFYEITWGCDGWAAGFADQFWAAALCRALATWTRIPRKVRADAPRLPHDVAADVATGRLRLGYLTHCVNGWEFGGPADAAYLDRAARDPEWTHDVCAYLNAHFGGTVH